MTRDKQFKQRIRARMAKTGERYTTARLHLLDDAGRSSPAQHVTDPGYKLRGGVAADSSAITNALANIGVRRSDGSLISEPLIFAVSGGIGALYILWEFARHNSPVLTLGFSSRPQYSREWATAIEVLSDAIDFGDVATEATLQFRNAGSGDLSWTVSSSDDAVAVSPASGSLGAGARAAVTVLLDRDALSEGDYAGEVEI